MNVPDGARSSPKIDCNRPAMPVFIYTEHPYGDNEGSADDDCCRSGRRAGGSRDELGRRRLRADATTARRRTVPGDGPTVRLRHSVQKHSCHGQIRIWQGPRPLLHRSTGPDRRHALLPLALAPLSGASPCQCQCQCCWRWSWWHCGVGLVLVTAAPGVLVAVLGCVGDARLVVSLARGWGAGTCGEPSSTSQDRSGEDQALNTRSSWGNRSAVSRSSNRRFTPSPPA